MFERIPLSNGEYTWVDSNQLPRLTTQKWHKHSQGYVVGSGGTPLMHRYITSAPIGAAVDHINGNKLDNRLQNLRVGSYSDNGHNRFASTGGIGVTGTVLRKGRYIVYIWRNGKNHYVGTVGSLAEAAIIRAQAEMQFVGRLSPNTSKALMSLGVGFHF